MNPKKKISIRKNNKISGVEIDSDSQVDESSTLKNSINAKKSLPSMKDELSYEKNFLSQNLWKLDVSLRNRLEFDQYLKQQASSFKKDLITIAKLDQLLQNSDLLSSLGAQLKEKHKSFVTTFSHSDSVSAQRKILRDEVREVLHTINKLE